ncbi:glycerate kinase [Flagellimonas allohymeniacidonis]|uniref:Glycerate kinase n=1 Tax=Flagellimonas allohymeniacidonis TaxID=2517819 RepID=A0A4Q8QDS3_9FLAO|nr:glycerate kinase [Allomuricauda hymeniacidonis]TAI47268.1 glycerate kinase [Allomuricauda hymeniacidonis]
MKFVVAPDKYKGSLTGQQFCEAVGMGILKVFPSAEIVKKPLADGGDGTIEVVKHYLNAVEIETTVKDPIFRDIRAGYLFSNEKGVAFIEMSEASGYKLLSKEELHCMEATSLGTGELIAHALDQGAKEIILGIGGSATNDGGIGMATALGYQFLDGNGDVLSPIGQNLSRITQIITKNVHPKLKQTTFKVACDVKNPLYGKDGAAHVYGPQKGASPEDVVALDKGLQNFAQVVQKTFGMDVQHIPGAGAAGGMGAGAVVFLNASLISGIDLIMEMANFDEVMKDADWIITGEGQLDQQTLSGKTIAGVLKAARDRNIPVAALCGSVTLSMDELEATGLQYVTSILNQVGSLEEAKKESFKNLEMASYNFAKLLQDTKAK